MTSYKIHILYVNQTPRVYGRVEWIFVVIKVYVLSEGQKNLKKYPSWFYLVDTKSTGRFHQFFEAFSEYINFNQIHWTLPSTLMLALNIAVVASKLCSINLIYNYLYNMNIPLTLEHTKNKFANLRWHNRRIQLFIKS